ncbi:GTP pyrophosphokinase [Rhodococcus ruber]
MSITQDSTSELPFTYDQFKQWYEILRKRRLEPALSTTQRFLAEALEDNLDEFDKARIKLGPTRIKSPARVWSKLSNPKYLNEVTELDDIPRVIDDLVGVRIICNNISDIGTVQTILTQLPDFEECDHAGISIETSKERLYHENPKESGYRAYHVNLSTRVNSAADWFVVSVELQVRTLLQDGWGELTHEDTYKPGVELPTLIQTLARRMASLLSCVDELAQDLRDELDQLSRTSDVPVHLAPTSTKTDNHTASITLPNPLHSPSGTNTLASQEVPEQALLEEVRDIVRNLDRPETLATVAFQLQSMFGAHIAQRAWGRFGSFKALLTEAVPDVRIEYIGPGWIIPPGFEKSDIPYASYRDNDEPNGAPAAILKLRPYEKGIPAVAETEMRQYLNCASAALDYDLWNDLELDKAAPGIQQVSSLSKSLRDKIALSGSKITRAKLGYLLNALLQTGNLRPGLSSREVREILLRYIVARISHHNVEVSAAELDELESWMSLP